MRSRFLAAMAALAIAMALPNEVRALPAEGQTAIGGVRASPSIRLEARYIVRCHNVRIWRHGQRVWVRRCHRHYY